MARYERGLATAKYALTTNGGLKDRYFGRHIINGVALVADTDDMSRYCEVGFHRAVPYSQAEKRSHRIGGRPFVKQRKGFARITEQDLSCVWENLVTVLCLEFQRVVEGRKSVVPWVEKRYGFDYLSIVSLVAVTVSKEDEFLAEVLLAHDMHQYWKFYLSKYVEMSDRLLAYQYSSYTRQQLKSFKRAQIFLNAMASVRDPLHFYVVYSQVPTTRRSLFDVMWDEFPERWRLSRGDVLDRRNEWERVMDLVTRFPLPDPYFLRRLPERDERRAFHARNALRLEFVQMAQSKKLRSLPTLPVPFEDGFRFPITG